MLDLAKVYWGIRSGACGCVSHVLKHTMPTRSRGVLIIWLFRSDLFPVYHVDAFGLYYKRQEFCTRAIEFYDDHDKLDDMWAVPPLIPLLLIPARLVHKIPGMQPWRVSRQGDREEFSDKGHHQALFLDGQCNHRRGRSYTTKSAGPPPCPSFVLGAGR